MFQKSKNYRMIGAGVALLLLLTAMLAACSGALGRGGVLIPPPSTQAANISSAILSPYTVTIAEQGINITRGIPSGLVQLTFKNVDSTRHSATLYRLKDGMPIADFYALFEDNPRDTLPITEALGSYEIDGNQVISGDFKLVPGIYIVVDDLAKPPRYASFQVRD